MSNKWKRVETQNLNLMEKEVERLGLGEELGLKERRIIDCFHQPVLWRLIEVLIMYKSFEYVEVVSANTSLARVLLYHIILLTEVSDKIDYNYTDRFTNKIIE